MATGTVKWFNNAKGYGFVLSEDKGDDLFIHYSSIQMDGYKSLKAGQEVEYDVQEGPKGLHAVNIRSTAAQLAAASSDSDHSAENAASEAATSAAEAEPVEDDLTRNPMHNVPTPDAALAAAQNGQAQRQVEVELD